MTRNFSLSAKLATALRTLTCQAKGCNEPLSDGVEWDHIVPHKLGGDNSAENCQALCKKCHAKKTNGFKHYGGGDKYEIAKAKRLANGGKKRRGRKLQGRASFPQGRKLQSRPFETKRN